MTLKEQDVNALVRKMQNDYKIPPIPTYLLCVGDKQMMIPIISAPLKGFRHVVDIGPSWLTRVDFTL